MKIADAQFDIPPPFRYAPTNTYLYYTFFLLLY